MPSKVYLVKTATGESADSVKNKLKLLIRESAVLGCVKPKDFVAIKLTFGEKDNKGHIDPAYVGLIVDEIKKIKGMPFLTDTNTLYKGERMNAIDHLNLAMRHGFTYERVKAPIIIADGLRSQDTGEVKIDKVHFKKVKIASNALFSDVIVGLTHFTGHMVTSFGGAIKNLGMGFASRAGKLIQHSDIAPSVHIDKCTLCKKCMDTCPADAIIIKDNKAHINKDACIGCGECIVACKFDAIKISWDSTVRKVQEKMAEFAYAAVKGKRKGFITFATKITKECDCLAKDDPRITEDIGILASDDPVAIDKAAVDLVIKNSGKDIFAKLHKETQWHSQIEHGEKIGLGSANYELIEIK